MRIERAVRQGDTVLVTFSLPASVLVDPVTKGKRTKTDGLKELRKALRAVKAS